MFYPEDVINIEGLSARQHMRLPVSTEDAYQQLVDSWYAWARDEVL